MSEGYLVSPLLPLFLLVCTKLQLTCVREHTEVPFLPGVGGVHSSAEALYPHPLHQLWPRDLRQPLPQPLFSALSLGTAAWPCTSKEHVPAKDYGKHLAKGTRKVC